MRKPFPIAAQNHLGLFNDVIGDKNSTDNWLDWIQNGWDGIGGFAAKKQDPEQLQKASIMPDFWKYSYSGGEISSYNPAQDYFSDNRIMETLQEVRDSHTSWTLASTIAQMKSGVDINEHIQSNLDLLLKTMGYRFILESIVHKAEATAGDSVILNTIWNNKGIAPFYYDWPLEFVLADSLGNLVANTRTKANADIRNWLPGRHNEISAMNIPLYLPKGEYTLLAAIVDPDTREPGIHLAIEGKRLDGWYNLNKISIN
jgi:hypothetical protein